MAQDIETTEWAKVRKYFEHAASLQREQRGRYLDTVCSDNPELRAEVEELLVEHDQLSGPLATHAGILGEAGAVLEPSDVIAGRFEIIRPLGHGGMGEVYEAYDRALGEHVALKTVRPELVYDGRIRERFKHEILNGRKVTHENVCRIHDLVVSQGEDGSPLAFTMELLAGETLAERLHKYGRLEPGQTLAFGRQMAEGLTALHEQGIIHRDFKPANIFITESEASASQVKITDFGLARRQFGGEAGLESLSGSHDIIGTPIYMAPEQLKGERDRVGPATDVYALGLVLYEMVTGVRPFSAESLADNVVQKIQQTPVLPSGRAQGLPEHWDDVLLSCLAVEPQDRPPGPLEVIFALENPAQSRPDRAKQASQRTTEGGAATLEDWPPSRLATRGLFAAVVLVMAVISTNPWASPERKSTELKQITHDAGLTFQPALSRDGAFLAYSSDREGDGDLNIWVQDVAGGDSRMLVNRPGDDEEPDFSPDGRYVVFSSSADGGGIYIASIAGEQPILVARGGRGPRYSPQGDKIAYWEGSDNFTHCRLYLTSPDGSSPRRLVEDFAIARKPVWSPDGRLLLFEGVRGESPTHRDQYDWWVVSLADGSVTRTGAIEALQQAGVRRPTAASAWLADTLLFSSRMEEGANLWELRLDSGFRVAGTPEWLMTAPGFQTSPAVSLDGAVAFGNVHEDIGIWSLPLDVADASDAQAPTLITSREGNELAPSLSSDGRMLAYELDLGSNREIVVRDLETGQETLLTRTEADKERMPTITADGSQVAYAPEIDDPPTYVVNIDGSGRRELSKRCLPWHWSWDSQRLLCQPLGSDALAIAYVSRDTGEKTVVTEHPTYRLYDADFSPDGAWISFHADIGTGGRQLFISPVDEGRVVTSEEWIAITDGSRVEGYSAWAPRGDAVYFVSDRTGSLTTWKQPLDVRTKRPAGAAVQHYAFPVRQSSLQGLSGASLKLSIAADKMAIALLTTKGNVWIADFSQLKDRAVESLSGDTFSGWKFW